MKPLIRIPSRPSVELQKAAAHAIQVKGAPVLSYPAQMFFDIADKNWDAGTLRGLQAYALSVLAYACMRYRSTKLIEAPVWIIEETDNGDEWVKDHELARVLEQPNPDMEMADLLEYTSLYLDGTGRALWVKSRDGSGRVGALYPFSRDEFSVSPASDRLYGKFTVQTRGGPRDYGPDDVVFFKNSDPRNPLNGLGPLEVALSQINISRSMQDAVRAQLRRAIRPGATIEFENILDEDTREVFKAQLPTQFAGAMTGSTMVLEGGKLNMLPWTIKDLALGPVQGDVEAAVCSAFQVHPAVVGAKLGIENSSSWADTIRSATELFYDLFALPTWARIEKTLTRSLLREVDDNPLRFVRFDKDRIRALQADMTKRTGEANAAANYWTVNERRNWTGKAALEPDDNRGDEIGNVSTNPFAGLMDPNTAAKDGGIRLRNKSADVRVKGRVIKGADIPSADERQLMWKSFDRTAAAEERTHEEAALELFQSERTAIASMFTSQGKSGDDEKFLDELLKRLRTAYEKGGDYHTAWFERYIKLIAHTIDVGAGGIAAQVGFDFSLSNPRVQAAIEARSNKLTNEVTEFTYQLIKRAVSEGRSAGLGVREIADTINNDVFGGTAEVRSVRIARTETIGAMNEGEHLSAVQSGVLAQKEWLTQGDGRVRETHAAIDGLRISIDDAFPNGLRFPGDQRGSAEEVIQCRCTLLYHDEGDGKSASRPVVNITMPEIKLPEQPTPEIRVEVDARRGKTTGRMVRNQDGSASFHIDEGE